MTHRQSIPVLINNVVQKPETSVMEGCRDWANGVCWRSWCPFQHGPQCQSVKAFPDKFFPTKASIGSEDCPEYLSGSCKRAGLCKLRHPRNTLTFIREEMFNKLLVPTKAEVNQYCDYFLQNRCEEGCNCRYIHPPPLSPNFQVTHILHTDAKIRGYCRDFLRGECSRGQRCMYIHAGPPQAPQDQDHLFILPTNAHINRYCRDAEYRCQWGSQCQRGSQCHRIHYFRVPQHYNSTTHPIHRPIPSHQVSRYSRPVDSRMPHAFREPRIHLADQDVPSHHRDIIKVEPEPFLKDDSYYQSSKCDVLPLASESERSSSPDSGDSSSTYGTAESSLIWDPNPDTASWPTSSVQPVDPSIISCGPSSRLNASANRIDRNSPETVQTSDPTTTSTQRNRTLAQPKSNHSTPTVPCNKPTAQTEGIGRVGDSESTVQLKKVLEGLKQSLPQVKLPPSKVVPDALPTVKIPPTPVPPAHNDKKRTLKQSPSENSLASSSRNNDRASSSSPRVPAPVPRAHNENTRTLKLPPCEAGSSRNIVRASSSSPRVPAPVPRAPNENKRTLKLSPSENGLAGSSRNNDRAASSSPRIPVPVPRASNENKRTLKLSPSENSLAGSSRNNDRVSSSPRVPPVKGLTVLDPQPPPDAPTTLTLHEHLRVWFGPGFQIEQVVTGFESPWMLIRNVPSTATIQSLSQSLGRFGSIQDIKLPQSIGPVRVRFSSAEEARLAQSRISGKKLLGTQVEAHLPISRERGKNFVLQDATLRIEWEAPERIAYGGYSDRKHAQNALNLLPMTIKDASFPITGYIYTGVPALGEVTLKFEHVPPTADSGFMERLGKPDAVVFEAPNYTSKEESIQGMKKIVSSCRGLVTFEMEQNPPRLGFLRAYAHFSSHADAQAAAKNLHNRKPWYTGHTRVSMRNILSVTLALDNDKFSQIRYQLVELQQGQLEPGVFITIIPKVATVVIRLVAEEPRLLVALKTRVDNIVRGDTVRHNGETVWDRFFSYPAGVAFLNGLKATCPDLTSHCNIHRRSIHLFGPPKSLVSARSQIIIKWVELRSRRLRTIPLAGRVHALFVTSELDALQKKYGYDNISLSALQWVLNVRGPDYIYEAALAAVRSAEQRVASGEKRKDSGPTCPICLNTIVPSSKTTIPSCGHSCCRPCLANYLRSTINGGYFPITCLGNDATCKEKVPMWIARNLVAANEYESIAESALLAYVESKPSEFKYCPTPDCSQIYRPLPQGSVLQCPSCLTRICPHCHVRYHDHTTCDQFILDSDDTLEKWVKENDVKRCPGCDVLIERNAGCNHMVCTRCSTHICWVCMKTFPDGGKGIYKHMSEEHGGWGLPDDPYGLEE